MWKILTIAIFFCASSASWSADAVPDGIADNVAAIAEGIEAMNSCLAVIEGYASATAVTAALMMGLIIWRLVLLSKNQKSLF